MTEVTDAMVSLVECPIGLFFYEHEHGRVLCLKTEYGNNKGRIDAYIVASGEFFWGAAPQTIASQRAQMVRPVPLAAVEAALAARPEPEGMETTAEEREAYARAAETELVWPEAGFVGRLLRDFDRLSAEIASLKARLAEAEAALKPFALVAEHDIGNGEADEDRYRPMTEGYNYAPLITVGDLRRALATRARGGSDD